MKSITLIKTNDLDEGAILQGVIWTDIRGSQTPSAVKIDDAISNMSEGGEVLIEDNDWAFLNQKLAEAVFGRANRTVFDLIEKVKKAPTVTVEKKKPVEA